MTTRIKQGVNGSNAQHFEKAGIEKHPKTKDTFSILCVTSEHKEGTL